MVTWIIYNISSLLMFQSQVLMSSHHLSLGDLRLRKLAIRRAWLLFQPLHALPSIENPGSSHLLVGLMFSLIFGAPARHKVLGDLRSRKLVTKRAHLQPVPHAAASCVQLAAVSAAHALPLQAHAPDLFVRAWPCRMCQVTAAWVTGRMGHMGACMAWACGWRMAGEWPSQGLLSMSAGLGMDHVTLVVSHHIQARLSGCVPPPSRQPCGSHTHCPVLPPGFSP